MHLIFLGSTSTNQSYFYRGFINFIRTFIDDYNCISKAFLYYMKIVSIRLKMLILEVCIKIYGRMKLGYIRLVMVFLAMK